MSRSSLACRKSSYIAQVDDHGDCTLIFSVKNRVGVLVSILKPFQDCQINLKHIESRSSKKLANHYEFAVIFSGHYDVSRLIEKLRKETSYLEVISREKDQNKETTLPWFPLRIRDLDQFSNHILMYGSDLDADHPGFRDSAYRERRNYFSNIAKRYRHGQTIPRAEYNR